MHTSCSFSSHRFGVFDPFLDLHCQFPQSHAIFHLHPLKITQTLDGLLVDLIAVQEGVKCFLNSVRGIETLDSKMINKIKLADSDLFLIRSMLSPKHWLSISTDFNDFIQNVCVYEGFLKQTYVVLNKLANQHSFFTCSRVLYSKGRLV